MLLDKHGGKADEHHRYDNERLEPLTHVLFLQPRRRDAHGIGHVERRAHAGGRVRLVNEANTRREEILSGEYLRAHILPVGIDNVDRHGYHLGDDDKNLEPLEALHVIQHQVQQRKHDQEIPEYVRDQEPLAEGNQIVDPAVDNMAAFRGNQVLRQKIHDKVADPAAQKL